MVVKLLQTLINIKKDIFKQTYLKTGVPINSWADVIRELSNINF